jgi:hypothetical protein
MDVTECKVRVGLAVAALVGTLPLLVLAAVPWRPAPRAFFPSWYNELWMFRVVRVRTRPVCLSVCVCVRVLCACE